MAIVKAPKNITNMPVASNAASRSHFVHKNNSPTNISSIGSVNENIPTATSGSSSYRITTVANSPGSAILSQAE